MFGEIEVLFDKFTMLINKSSKSSFKTGSKFIYQLTHTKGQNSLLNTKVQVQSNFPFHILLISILFVLENKVV